jgi:cytochrome c biogenesis protein CcdA
MIGTAFALALLSGLWPVGLAVMAAYLERPLLRYSVAYLAGAAFTESLASAVVLLGLGAAGFSSQHPTRNGWLDIAVGLLMLAFSAWLMLRERNRPAKSSSSADRRAREGRVAIAFGVGMAMWLPSATYLAALKEINDSHSGWALTTIYAAICVVLVLWILWIPLLLMLFYRERARGQLERANGWINRHGVALLAGLTAVFGVILIIKGITTLT